MLLLPTITVFSVFLNVTLFAKLSYSLVAGIHD